MSTVVPATARSHIFRRLSPGGQYTLSVAAVNGSASGPVVSASVQMTALPGKPRIKKPARGAKHDKLVSVKAKWKAPTSGGPVAKYWVTAVNKKTGARTTVTASPRSRSKTVAGLSRNVSYVVKVRAGNASGAGAASARSTSVKAR